MTNYKGRWETWYTVKEFAKLNNVKLTQSEAITVGRDATKLTKQQGVTPERREEGSIWVNMYPESILNDVVFDGE